MVGTGDGSEACVGAEIDQNGEDPPAFWAGIEAESAAGVSVLDKVGFLPRGLILPFDRWKERSDCVQLPGGRVKSVNQVGAYRGGTRLCSYGRRYRRRLIPPGNWGLSLGG
jgi:hypothetical protein